ncbi:MAG: transposase [Planctomycetota bacterium]
MCQVLFQKITLPCNNLRYNTSKKLKIPENATIFPLPSYSPELNPVENLWHYLRSHY